MARDGFLSGLGELVAVGAGELADAPACAEQRFATEPRRAPTCLRQAPCRYRKEESLEVTITFRGTLRGGSLPAVGDRMA
jgi:hypothetical protein